MVTLWFFSALNINNATPLLAQRGHASQIEFLRSRFYAFAAPQEPGVFDFRRGVGPPSKASFRRSFIPAPRRCPRRMLAVYSGIMGDLSKRRSTGTLFAIKTVSIHAERLRSFLWPLRAAATACKTFAISVAQTWCPHAGRERGLRIHVRHTLPEVSRCNSSCLELEAERRGGHAWRPLPPRRATDWQLWRTKTVGTKPPPPSLYQSNFRLRIRTLI